MRRMWLVALLLVAACGGAEEAAEDGAEQEVTACGKDTWKSYAGKFFKTECRTCHAREFGSAAAVEASHAQAAILAGSMPRDKPLSAAQKKRILAWFSCGAP